MEKRVCHSVGLAGDLDEVQVIQDVEEAFAIKLDYSDAPGWFTAGDVFASLERALAPDAKKEPDVWDRFATVLARQTGMDPSLIEPCSPLLSSSRFWARINEAYALVGVIVTVALLGSVAIALL